MDKLTASALVAALGFALLSGAPKADAQTAGTQSKTLYLFTWADYIDPDLVKSFETRCDCKLVESDFDSQASMLSKMQLGGANEYDVVIPPNYTVPQLVAQNLIQKIDPAEITNFNNLAPKFRDLPNNPGDAYAVPYQWGTTGVVYTKSIVRDPGDSWGLLFDPKQNPAYPFALMGDNGRNTIGAACAYLGYGLNCDQKSQWIAAAKLILATKKRPNFVGFFGGDELLARVKKGSLAIGMAFNGSVAECGSDGDGSCAGQGYFVPSEGSEIWMDTMAIPAHAPDPALALQFIDFILGAKQGAALSNFNLYGSPNQAAGPYLAAVLKGPLLMPNPQQMSRLQYMQPLSGEKLKTFDAIWSSVIQ